MKQNELKQKIDAFEALDKELQEIGMCGCCHDSGRGYYQFSLEHLIKLAKEYNLSLEVEPMEEYSPYPFEVVSHDLKAYAITESVTELLKHGLIEITEGSEHFIHRAKTELAELKVRLMALEEENKQLKNQIASED
jgi:hypothetical protein